MYINVLEDADSLLDKPVDYLPVLMITPRQAMILARSLRHGSVTNLSRLALNLQTRYLSAGEYYCGCVAVYNVAVRSVELYEINGSIDVYRKLCPQKNSRFFTSMFVNGFAREFR